MTPMKDPNPSRSQVSETLKVSENLNPNFSTVSPSLKKFANSPAIGSAKSKKSASKNPDKIPYFRNTIQERKFVVAKKNSKRPKCPQIAYENLRASQEEFFQKRTESDESKNEERSENKKEEKDLKIENEGFGFLTNELKIPKNEERGEIKEEDKDQEAKTIGGLEEKSEEGIGFLRNELKIPEQEEFELSDEGGGDSKVRKMRHRLLEEARNSIPESGSGRVMFLVKTFERVLSIPNSKEKEDEETQQRNKAMKWALPGLQSKVSETDGSSCSLSSADLFFGSKNFDMDSRVDSSMDSSNGSISSRTSGGGRRSRRNSSESSGRHGGKKWEKKLKVTTSQQPFKLRTEQRGRFKKEEFHKKVEEMVMEEKKQRIPIAQGLPWTTDEPECLVKPPVKESTRPVDLILHSDMRAVERAEFDHHVAEKLSLMEQYRLERGRQQRQEEEEEIRRLRRELVPKAQPMPYFDRPFIPKSCQRLLQFRKKSQKAIKKEKTS
ncbi:microtubule-destabilizing protein 60-like isoform X2 [Tasmannia lanceolata]|uniref:microtubule-destabilizing protein 60-like isoform X2 n=1 Tax=Tasmannia lanceolata TaxID=3420 RepID=UPI004064327E